MVESTPENLAPYLLYWWIVHLCKFWNIFSFTFSDITPEPSMLQQCTRWQKNHLNLANMAYFHHFCLKQSKTAQIPYERGAIIYESPCSCLECGPFPFRNLQRKIDCTKQLYGAIEGGQLCNMNTEIETLAQPNNPLNCLFLPSAKRSFYSCQPWGGGTTNRCGTVCSDERSLVIKTNM